MAAATGAGAGLRPTEDRAKSPPLTVSQLSLMIEGALRDHLPVRLRVLGEISGLSRRTHVYFSLKDSGAVLNCVMFASAARTLRFQPDAGQEVVLTGRVEFFGKQGRTQFYVERIEPVGAGALDLELRRLCEELRALGWFAPERKRPVPAFPRRVAVVTSRSGAALQDVLNTMRRRCPAVGVLIADVRVQGEEACDQIARTIRAIGDRHVALGVDVVLVTRGGGSKEDLWCFNDRRVAAAIVECAVPVVAAIGHETDVTIAELVADERCATPTQAAMRVTPDSGALLEQLDSLASRLSSLLRRHVQQEQVRLAAAARHRFLSDPGAMLAQRAEALRRCLRQLATEARSRLRAGAHSVERLAARLETHRPGAVYARREARLRHAEANLRASVEARLQRVDLADRQRALQSAWTADARRRLLHLDAAERALDLVGPASVLRRGYSCTLKADGSVVRSTATVKPGDNIRTVVADGSFTSTVGSDRPGTSTPPASLRRSKGSPAARSNPRDQMDLFDGGG